MLRIEDSGEILYGGAVTLAEWWDEQRVKDGKITNADILRKASFYTYLGVGLVATLSSVFNFFPSQAAWMEHISHGFLYDLPRFARNMVMAMSPAPAGAGSRAVRQAQEILAARQRAAAETAKQLAAARQTSRTYQPEFEQAGAY